MIKTGSLQIDTLTIASSAHLKADLTEIAQGSAAQASGQQSLCMSLNTAPLTELQEQSVTLISAHRRQQLQQPEGTLGAPLTG